MLSPVAFVLENRTQAKVSTKKVDGKEFLIVPVVMIRTGVHNGSRGPLLYTPDELQSSVDAWNNVPVTLDHPMKDGHPISASDTSVAKVGTIKNAKLDKGKLVANAWLDVASLKELAPDVLKSIKNSKSVEVSTGFSSQIDNEEGEHNGDAYTGVVKNIQPDHLAILTDAKGACSIDDGCGLLRNMGVLVCNAHTQSRKWQLVSDSLREKHGTGVWLVDMAEKFAVYQDGTRMMRVTYALGDDDVVTLADDSEQVSKYTKYRKKNGWYVNVETANSTVRNELSQGEKYTMLCDALRTSRGQSVYVVDVYDSFFVFQGYESGSARYYMQGYALDDDTVSLTGTPVEVQRQIKYRTLEGDVVNAQMSASEMKARMKEIDAEMESAEGDDLDALKKEMASLKKKMTANREETKMAECTCAGKEKTVNAETPAPVAPAVTAPAAAAKPVTVDEYIANAPEGLRDVLRSGVNSYNRDKTQLIETITANKRNVFTKEQLSAKSMEELAGIAALAGETTMPAKPVANYAGNADVTTGTTQIEPLALPTINFDPPVRRKAV